MSMGNEHFSASVEININVGVDVDMDDAVIDLSVHANSQAYALDTLSSYLNQQQANARHCSIMIDGYSIAIDFYATFNHLSILLLPSHSKNWHADLANILTRQASTNHQLHHLAYATQQGLYLYAVHLHVDKCVDKRVDDASEKLKKSEKSVRVDAWEAMAKTAMRSYENITETAVTHQSNTNISTNSSIDSGTKISKKIGAKASFAEQAAAILQLAPKQSMTEHKRTHAPQTQQHVHVQAYHNPLLTTIEALVCHADVLLDLNELNCL